MSLAKQLQMSTNGWQLQEPMEETVVIAGTTITLHGLAAVHPEYGEVVGASASIREEAAKASYELLERMTIQSQLKRGVGEYHQRHWENGAIEAALGFAEVFPTDTTEHWRLMRSNGVALHSSWSEAALRAGLELIERQRVLGSWLGYYQPEKIVRPPLSQPLEALQTLYAITRMSFGTQRIEGQSKTIHVAGIHLQPKDHSHPMILAFGAEYSEVEALAKAEGEMWQRLGFLWGEAIPAEEPAFETSQLYHQEYYLYPKHHGLVERWLSGEFFDPRSAPADKPIAVNFVDISSEESGGFVVAKALSKETLPCYFGRYNRGAYSHIGDERLIHPVS